jgi:23S rRNA (uracil1939-C5)-methyltransferase
MKRGEEITVTLEGFAFEGKSIARVEGLVIFVTGAVPGDTVRVRLTKIKKTFCEAVALEIVTASPLRVVPRCAHFGVCGGCRWQNVAYDAQLAFKRQHVVDALERIGGFRGIAVEPTIGSDDPYYYRNKMEFSFGERWLSEEEIGARREEGAPPADRFALGLHLPERFDRVLDIRECWLQSETSNRILTLVRAFARAKSLSIFSTRTHEGYLRNLVIRQSRHTGEVMVNLVTHDENPALMQELAQHLLREVPEVTTIVNNITERKSQVAVGERELVIHGPGTITERIGKRTYRISANSFFQTNTLQAERLYETARRCARLRPEDLVYDLYSGTGTIALHIADDVRQVVAVESVASAVADARRNAESNNVGNCVFLLGDLKEVLTRQHAMLAPFGPPDAMIIDPPRAGMHEEVVRRVLALAPERIVYVSCNPATQARDLALLASAYRIAEVRPVDMFPHTFHIENVVALSR